MIESFQKYLEAQDYAPYTIDLYGSAIRELLDFVNAEPENVTSEMIEQWMISHKDWGASTKKWHYSAVKKFFRYCVDRHILDKNPADILPSIPQRRHIDESAGDDKEECIYSPEALKAMIDFEDVRDRKFIARDRAIIVLMAGTGLRASEVGWMNVGNWRGRSGDTMFALRKGQSVRKIVVAPFVAPYIDAYLAGRDCDDDAPLFLSSCGGRMTRITIYNMLKTRQKALNLKTGTHNMRRTVLSAIAGIANPVVARDVAGHHSIDITNRYLVSTGEERTQAVSKLPWAEMLKGSVQE